MARGKKPFTEKAEQFFKRPLWKVLEKECKNCENVFEIADKIAEISKGKLTVSPICVLSTINKALKDGSVKKVEPYISWSEKAMSKNGSNGRRGKVGIEEKAKNNGFDFWPELEKLAKKLNSLDELAGKATKKFKLDIKASTLKNLIYKAKREGNPSDHLLSLISSGKRGGGRGKKGLREKLQEQGIDILAIAKEQASYASDIKELSNLVQDKANHTINQTTLRNILMKAFENGEIKEDDSLNRILNRRQKKREAKEAARKAYGNSPNAVVRGQRHKPLVDLDVTCRSCGHQYKTAQPVRHFGNTAPMMISCKKCPNCQKSRVLEAVGEVCGVTIRLRDDLWCDSKGESQFSGDAFVNEKGKRIDSPFMNGFEFTDLYRKYMGKDEENSTEQKGSYSTN